MDERPERSPQASCGQESDQADVTLEVVETDQAFVDIVQLADYIAEHGSLEASDRVVSAIRKTYENLASFPEIGIAQSYGPTLLSMRMVPVTRFPNYLIFYQATDKRLIIRRVLHGARNVNLILGDID